MKKFLFSAIICFFAILSFGQISTDERPPSFDNTLINRILQEQKTDTKIMSTLDMVRIQQEDEEDAQKGVPPRFGFPHDVSFNLNNSGVWITMPNGDRIWRLELHCPGADLW